MCEKKCNLPPELIEAIDQVTTKKLEHSREALRRAGLPHTGTRGKVRERLVSGLQDGGLRPETLVSLLDELDRWGDQRLKLSRFRARDIGCYRDDGCLREKARACGMEDLVGRAVDLVPPAELTPMSIRLVPVDGRAVLRIEAAKSRAARLQQSQIEPKTDPDYPGIIFLPFKDEVTKAVYFAEVDPLTGMALVSVPSLHGTDRYAAEFGEFRDLFEPLLDLELADDLDLSASIQRVSRLPNDQVCLYVRYARTSVGGSVRTQSHSSRADVRSDRDLEGLYQSFAGRPDEHCNCYWLADGVLGERVHTIIYAPKGEVSILGKVREHSARHVLQRIIALN